MGVWRKLQEKLFKKAREHSNVTCLLYANLLTLLLIDTTKASVGKTDL